MGDWAARSMEGDGRGFLVVSWGSSGSAASWATAAAAADDDDDDVVDVVDNGQRVVTVILWMKGL